jgi:hypothetical protein
MSKNKPWIIVETKGDSPKVSYIEWIRKNKNTLILEVICEDTQWIKGCTYYNNKDIEVQIDKEYDVMSDFTSIIFKRFNVKWEVLSFKQTPYGLIITLITSYNKRRKSLVKGKDWISKKL